MKFKFKFPRKETAHKGINKWKPKKYDFGLCHCRLIYNDGSMVEDISKQYGTLKRYDMKSISIIMDSKPIYTLQINNNKLIYRMRNFARGLTGGDAEFSFATPKRCVVLGTEGKIVFVWDDGYIEELKEWKNEEPYTRPNLRDEER